MMSWWRTVKGGDELAHLLLSRRPHVIFEAEKWNGNWILKDVSTLNDGYVYLPMETLALNVGVDFWYLLPFGFAREGESRRVIEIVKDEAVLKDGGFWALSVGAVLFAGRDWAAIEV